MAGLRMMSAQAQFLGVPLRWSVRLRRERRIPTDLEQSVSNA